jgi:hypothetical protein
MRTSAILALTLMVMHACAAGLRKDYAPDWVVEEVSLREELAGLGKDKDQLKHGRDETLSALKNAGLKPSHARLDIHLREKAIRARLAEIEKDQERIAEKGSLAVPDMAYHIRTDVAVAHVSFQPGDIEKEAEQRETIVAAVGEALALQPFNQGEMSGQVHISATPKLVIWPRAKSLVVEMRLWVETSIEADQVFAVLQSDKFAGDVATLAKLPIGTVDISIPTMDEDYAPKAAWWQPDHKQGRFSWLAPWVFIGLLLGVTFAMASSGAQDVLSTCTPTVGVKYSTVSPSPAAEPTRAGRKGGGGRGGGR